MEQQWEHPWPLAEGHANPTLLCRPALTLCLPSSQSQLPHATVLSLVRGVHLVLQQQVHPCKLIPPLPRISSSRDPKRFHMEECSGTNLSSLLALILRECLQCLFLLHGSPVMEQAFQHEQAPFLLLGSGPNQVFPM